MAVNLESLFPQSLVLPSPDQPLDSISWPSGGGVYAFVDAEGRVLQAIGAQSLKRSMRHRLEPAEEASKKRADLRAITHTVRWRLTASTFETSLVYLAIARELNPSGYRKELGFESAWFAQLNLQESFPRWTVDKHLARKPADAIGPFSSRRRCRAYVELLEDVFDLCRKYEILVQAPHGSACAYYEMGQCPAPCDGSISFAVYLGMLKDSLQFATGYDRSRLEEMDCKMREAAVRQEFEHAARIKALLDRIRKNEEDAGRYSSTPDSFRYLIIQRDVGRAMLKPWCVRGGSIEELESSSYRELEASLPGWIERCRNMVCHDDTVDYRTASEHVWLVCHFLAQNEKAPGCFLPLESIQDECDLHALSDSILTRFRRASSTSENISGEDTVNP